MVGNFDGKTLLVTGGTGSFGSAFVRKMLGFRLKEIRVFSRDEKKQEDMRIELNNDRVKFIIGDIRDFGSVSDAMRNVNYVFHAAALKQVPSCEFFPIEAVKTNILGAENTINASIANLVEKVVLLSTDKAVYPINAMGMSKAMMEKLMIAKSRSLSSGNTLLCGTRYGNVMASRGSVIPLFVDLIRSGQPLLVTDPAMTRFLMSIEESIELVLYAFNHAKQGDIFVQKSPSTTLGVLADALKDIFKADNPIKILGTRHGEKLYESLISKEEMLVAEEHGHFFRVPADNRGLNYDKYIATGERLISDVEDYNSHNTVRLGFDETKNLLLSLDFIQGALND
jgi:UDP-glucose 4-epimerase